MDDDYFVINGGCCTVREKFYPVRSIVHLVLRELIDRHASDRRSHLAIRQKCG